VLAVNPVHDQYHTLLFQPSQLQDLRSIIGAAKTAHTIRSRDLDPDQEYSNLIIISAKGHMTAVNLVHDPSNLITISALQLQPVAKAVKEVAEVVKAVKAEGVEKNAQGRQETVICNRINLVKSTRLPALFSILLRLYVV